MRFEVKPLGGVGPLSFGMSPLEVRRALRELSVRHSELFSKLGLTLDFGDENHGLELITLHSNRSIQFILEGCALFEDAAAQVLRVLEKRFRIIEEVEEDKVRAGCLFLVPALNLALFKTQPFHKHLDGAIVCGEVDTPVDDSAHEGSGPVAKRGKAILISEGREHQYLYLRKRG